VTGPHDDNRATTDGTLGLVVVDHGSRRHQANWAHEEFVRTWPDRGRYRAIEPAHMELAEPSIAAAFAACVAAGATTVVIAPYFLWPGSHWDRDIPELAAEASRHHPGIGYLVTAPLGSHPLLSQIVDERVSYCLAHATGGAPECEMCTGSGRCFLR